MKRILKYLAYGLILFAGIIGLFAFYFIQKFNADFEEKVSFTPAEIVIPTDSISIERGRLLSVGCRSCHGNQLEGKYFFDDPSIGKIASSNLTGGKGSATENYTDIDWIRSIRHGVAPDGRKLFVMPSESICHLSDRDLGSLIAFLKTLPKVENHFEKASFTTFAKILAGAGQFGEMYAYNAIDHKSVEHVAHPAEVNSLEHGLYMLKSHGCISCHSQDFKGGKSPDPVSPMVPNISATGNPGKWTRAQFINTLRSGKTPEGKMLDGQFMPFAGVASFSDDEIGSMYDYIMSLPVQ